MRTQFTWYNRVLQSSGWLNDSSRTSAVYLRGFIRTLLLNVVRFKPNPDNTVLTVSQKLVSFYRHKYISRSMFLYAKISAQQHPTSLNTMFLMLWINTQVIFTLNLTRHHQTWYTVIQRLIYPYFACRKFILLKTLFYDFVILLESMLPFFNNL